MWILWIITSKFRLLPVSGSTVWTPSPPRLWQVMQRGTIRRAPPWAERGSWQRLQLLVAMMSWVLVTGEPFGTKVKTLLSCAVPRLKAVRLRLAYAAMRTVWVGSKLAGALVPKVYMLPVANVVVFPPLSAAGWLAVL